MRKSRLCDSQKVQDKRCCAHQRRKEATIKATEQLETMVKRILSSGIQAQYLLMDSWFTMPATVSALAQHIDVIGMVKKSSKIFYCYNGHGMHLMAIYGKLKQIIELLEIFFTSAVTRSVTYHLCKHFTGY